MADNTKINVGTTGDTIATDDILDVKYQRMKITLGADGVNDGDISSANPMPVSGNIGITGDITLSTAIALPVSIADRITLSTADTIPIQIQEAIPTDASKYNPATVLTYNANGDVETITETIDAKNYQTTLSYTGSTLTGISAVVEV